MKVLITHELFPPEVWRMGEKVMYEIARKLKDRGIEIKVLTTGNPKIKGINGIPTVRLPINRYLMNLSVFNICKHVKGFDLIQTSNYNACFPSFLAGKLLGKPVVCLVQGAYGEKWLKMRGPLFGSISMIAEKFQINHDYDKMIFLSDYARKAALDIGVDKKITEVIKPGIELKKYKIGKKEPFVLFAGRLAKQKGLEYLIEAAKELPETDFLIAGSGEQERKLKSIAPKNVKFLGFVSGKKLIELYSKALIFCLPSIGETFGFVQLEAMASGCAIVSTVPFEFSGIRVEAGNSKMLKDAIEKLLNNKKMTIRMGRKNRMLAKKYDWDSFIDRLIEIYEKII